MSSSKSSIQKKYDENFAPSSHPRQAVLGGVLGVRSNKPLGVFIISQMSSSWRWSWLNPWDFIRQKLEPWDPSGIIWRKSSYKMKEGPKACTNPPGWSEERVRTLIGHCWRSEWIHVQIIPFVFIEFNDSMALFGAASTAEEPTDPNFDSSYFHAHPYFAPEALDSHHCPTTHNLWFLPTKTNLKHPPTTTTTTTTWKWRRSTIIGATP